MIKQETYKPVPGDVLFFNTEMRGLALCGPTHWKLVKASMSGPDVLIKRGVIVDGKMVVTA